MNTTKNSIAFKISKQPLDMNFRNSNKEVVLIIIHMSNLSQDIME